MKVHELMTVLAHVDPDLDIILYGRWSSHLTEVESRPRRQARHMREWVDIYGHRVLDPVVMLRGDSVWYAPAPPFRLSGRFRDQAGLDAKLTQLTGEPA